MTAPVKLTEVDFENIKQNLIDYLKSTKRFTDYDFAGSNLQVILNLNAYQSQLNAYSTNMLANETFLASASLRQNVVENANMLGYLPTSSRSAIVEFDLELRLNPDNYPNGFPEYLEIQPGAVMLAGSGTASFTFNFIDTQVAAIVNSSGVCRFLNVRAFEGNRLTHTFEVDKTDFAQRFVLANQNIDTTSIRVDVQEDTSEETLVAYRQANNLVTLTQESRVYWVEETKDSYYELTFGDGYFGRALAAGAKINVTYLVTNGNLANGVQDLKNYTFIGRVFDSYGTRVTENSQILQLGMINSGAEIESVPSIKLRAPKSYAAQKRCVTTDDYEAIIREIFPAVEDIYCYGGETLEIPQYGRVYIAIKPITGDAISAITKNYIKRSLERFRVASLDLAFVDPDVLNVELATTAFFDESKTNKDSSAIVSAVKDTLTSYKSDSVVSKFGGTVRYSTIIGIIDDSDRAITRNNTYFRMRKDVKPVINTDATYTLCFLNPLEIDCNNPVISSTGFRMEVNNIFDEKVYYMEDDTKGNIRTYYYTETNEKIIANNYFGTVDYETGEVLLGYQVPIKIINVTTDNELLEIRAIPRNQDVVAREATFINLDIAQSSIGAVIDTGIAKA